MKMIFLESVVVLVSIITGTLTQNCNKDAVINDHLGQRRVCHDGKMTAPCRVRREWSGLLPGERYRFIETIKKASARRDYKDLVNKHRNDFDHIHNSQQFLWWHRWYLLQMENILREVDPIVTVPYWDWSLWSGAPWLSQVMSTWSEAPWGFGANGERNKCVNSGPFGHEHWTMTDGGCLKRDFNGNPPDCIAVHKCLRLFAHEFPKFESTLREALHNTMHCRIGGTMCSKTSANAPEFLLHHCFTDKIWADWQKKDPRNKHPASLDPNIRLYGISPELKARALMDLFRQPGGVCVIYDDPPHESYDLCHNTLAKLTLKEIDKIRRHRFTRLSNLEFELFMMQSNGRTRATAEMETIEPKRILPKNAKLNPRDSARGFKAEDVEEAVKKRKREFLSGDKDEKNNTLNAMLST